MKHLKTHKNINGITFKEWLKINPKDLDVVYINCTGSYLIDLNGIEEFKNIKYIYCAYNKLEKLPDLSGLNNLYELNCSNNIIEELPDLTVLKSLKYLFCNSNKLPFECHINNNHLISYLEWHKKEYPWIYDVKKYNL